jgi:hypothetical protein
MKSALVLTVAVAFLFGPAIHPGDASASTPAAPAGQPAKKVKKPVESPSPSAENEGRAREAIIGFLKAKSVDEMGKFVRHPDISLPRMKAFYVQRTVVPLGRVSFHDLRVVDTGRSTLVLTWVSSGLEDQLIINSEVPAKGPAKVDWESYAGWCEVPWSGFVKEGSEKPREFRVRLTGSDYYNWSFSDGAKYACFKVTDKADEETLYSYCEKGSDVYKELMAALPPKGRPGREEIRHSVCTVKLSMKAGNIPHHQAVIESFVRQSWLEP